ETRITDFHAPPKSRGPAPRVRFPSIAVAPSTMFVVAKYEEGLPKHYIIRLRVPLAEIEKTNPGLPESKDANRSSRQLGEPATLALRRHRRHRVGARMAGRGRGKGIGGDLRRADQLQVTEKRALLEVLVASALVTAAVTAASSLLPDRYVATAVGFVFLGAT